MTRGVARARKGNIVNVLVTTRKCGGFGGFPFSRLILRGKQKSLRINLHLDWPFAALQRLNDVRTSLLQLLDSSGRRSDIEIAPFLGQLSDLKSQGTGPHVCVEGQCGVGMDTMALRRRGSPGFCVGDMTYNL